MSAAFLPCRPIQAACRGLLLRNGASSGRRGGAADCEALCQAAAAAVRWPSQGSHQHHQQHWQQQQQQQRGLSTHLHQQHHQQRTFSSSSSSSAAGWQHWVQQLPALGLLHPHTSSSSLSALLPPRHLLFTLPSAAAAHQPHFQQQQQQVRGFVLMPRRVKYRKAHKSVGFNETICPNTRQLAFGLYGIRALEHARIPARTLEAVRRTLRRTVKKSAMMWIRVTPNVPVTSKPAEVRMGKGKGALDYWAAPIRPGQVLFELDRCSKATAMQAMAAIQAKMPIKVGFLEWS